MEEELFFCSAFRWAHESNLANFKQVLFDEFIQLFGKDPLEIDRNSWLRQVAQANKQLLQAGVNCI
jgi:hypothetical protein